MLAAISLLLAAMALLGAADIADYTTQPRGTNPTLYNTSQDHVIQLDGLSFNDTVFCSSRGNCSSYLVEFYSDWCGHCRSYASLYKALAKDVRDWGRVVKVAAINCADEVNVPICRANGILFFPYIKYFPRNSTDTFYGVRLKVLPTLGEMRNQLTQTIVQDSVINHFDDWPNFNYLGDVSTYSEMWQGAKDAATTMAIVFEANAGSQVGAQLLLDLQRFGSRVTARRCLRSHALVDALHITEFPTLAIFRRGQRTPVEVAELRRLLFRELEQFLQAEDESPVPAGVAFAASKNAFLEECSKNPDSCRARYFVSETDMLKAMRYALFREVTRTGMPLEKANLTAVYSFVDTLVQHFPTTTLIGLPDSKETIVADLDHSHRARAVFIRLRDFLDAKGLEEPITPEAWQEAFIKAEAAEGDPFPVDSDWEHCKGSSQQFRGYTCGLWSTFHALTVNAYKQALNDKSFRALPMLQSVRDYIGNFMGCEHCRKHFLKMTTRTFKLETHVRRAEDGFVYLWRAHNIVNARLKDRDTEDPTFPKLQFPAAFLCPTCHDRTTEGRFIEASVQDFLIDYYSRIKPVYQITVFDDLEAALNGTTTVAPALAAAA